MIAASLIYNLIDTSSWAPGASNREKKRIACSRATYYRILFSSKQIQIVIFCRARLKSCCKGNAVHALLCWEAVCIRDEAFQYVYKNL